MGILLRSLREVVLVPRDSKLRGCFGLFLEKWSHYGKKLFYQFGGKMGSLLSWICEDAQ